MNTEEARRIIEQGEGQRTEFKQSFAGENTAIISLCAFANADGGTVFFGVTNEGRVIGVSVGGNTLENFANNLKANTQPPLTPPLETIHLDEKVIVIATIQKAGPGELFYAFDTPRVRVGKTNQVMSPSQQQARLKVAENAWVEERDRPIFAVINTGVTRLEARFELIWTLKQVSGDFIPDLEWRFRGPRFPMEWRQASGASLDRTSISATFNLTQKPKEEDSLVAIDEIGLDVRFQWRGKRRHELHRWPITRREFPQKVLWDVGTEKLPPLRFDEG